MKFYTDRTINNASSIFSVIVEDTEIASRNIHSSLTFNKFVNYVMARLGNMIAAYYFKHHKDELIQFINSDEVKEAIKQRLIEQVEVKIKGGN